MLIIILLILLASPQICVTGAVAGLTLWFNTILPTLLPFIIISNIILNVYSKDLKNPKAYIIFVGMCCGCPMAAIAAGNLYKNGQISQKDAQYLTGVCNTISPAFLISYTYMTTLQFNQLPVTLLVASYLPVLIMLLGNKTISIQDSITKKNSSYNSYFKEYTINKHNTENNTVKNNAGLSVTLLDESIMHGFATITKLGGYIIFFNIIAAYLKQLTGAYPLLNCIVTGIAEITTGMNTLKTAPVPIKLKYILAGGLTSFGGLCCFMQSAGILKESGLSAKKYIYHKILLSAITIALYYLAVYVLDLS